MARLRLATPNRLRLRGPGRLALTAGAAIVNASLVASDPSSLRVYQRVGTSKALTVSGSFTGSITQVQARAVPFGTALSDTSVAWTNVATDNTAKTFSGSISVPQGGWYVWQVRDASNASVNAVGSNKFGVGVVIALLGQSNMAHFSDNASGSWKYPLGDPKVVDYITTWQRLGNVNDSFPPNTLYDAQGYSSYTSGGTRADGHVYLGNLVSEGLGVPIALVNKAVTGSAISSWMSGQTNWNAFVSTLSAMGGDCEVALWHQGETDASTMSTATMVSNLGTLFNQLLTLTGRTSSNFHFGLISLGQGNFNGSTPGQFGNMRAAHVQFARTTAGAFLASAAHDIQTDTDNVHIGGAGFNILGRRYAKSVLARLGVGVIGSGPYITGASRSGTVITATVAHTGGTAITDGTGGAGSALTGFEVKDNGTVAAIASTAISGNTILITLAATPTGPVTLSYAMMDVPHSTGNDPKTAVVPASVVYDNATYFGGAVKSPFGLSAVGCPLQPLAAMAVS